MDTKTLSNAVNVGTILLRNGGDRNVPELNHGPCSWILIKLDISTMTQLLRCRSL